MLQIAVVGKSRFRVEVKTDLDVLVFELQGLGEAGEAAQGALGEGLGLLVARKAQQSLAQLGGQQRRQGTVLRRFDAHGLNARSFRVITHAVQEHGLAHSPESDHQDALGGQPTADPLGCHANGFTELIAARQFRRLRASAGSERV